jgi:hypothetical protein
MDTFIFIIFLAGVYLYNQNLWQIRFEYFKKIQNDKFCNFISERLNNLKYDHSNEMFYYVNYDINIKNSIKKYLINEYYELVAFSGNIFFNDTEVESFYRPIVSNYSKINEYYNDRCFN